MQHVFNRCAAAGRVSITTARRGAALTAAKCDAAGWITNTTTVPHLARRAPGSSLLFPHSAQGRWRVPTSLQGIPRVELSILDHTGRVRKSRDGHRALVRCHGAPILPEAHYGAGV